MYIGLRFSRFIVGFFALLWISSFANIDNLKGTYSILKQEYKEFSLVYGAIALQSDYLMHLYDYGTFCKKHVTQIRGITTMVPDLSGAPAVVKLVHSFFYRVPGHMGRGDFVLTNTVRTASLEDQTAIVKALAWDLVQVKRIKKFIEDETQGGELKGKLQQHIKKIPTGQYSIKKDIAHLRDIAGLDRKTGFLDIDCRKLKLFGLLWTAYQEEGKDESVFPPFSTDAVVLGIVYKIAGGSKAVLRSFYEKLNEMLVDAGDSIFNDPDIFKKEWVDDTFKPGDVAQLRDALTFNAIDTEQLRRSYEDIVYLGLLSGRYPKVAGYSTVVYSYNESGQNKQVTFVDCMETTLRNLTNIMLYNPETQEFDVSKIKNPPTQQLQDFYRAFKSATSVEDSAAHNAWTAVVENIPFVSYNRETADKTIKYELNPSLKNIILVFNHILGLNLFESEPGDSLESKIRNAVSRGDFIKVYFPQMCSSLGITCNGFFDNSGKKIELKDIDGIDYKDGIVITTKLKVASDAHNPDVIIKTHPGHGELSVVDKSEVNPIGKWLKNNFTHLVRLSNQNLSAELINICYLALCKNAQDRIILSDYLKNISKIFHINGILYLPIENADYVNYLIDTLYSMPGEFVLDANMFKLCLCLCNNIPDNNQKMKALLKVYIMFFKSHEGQQESKDAIEIASKVIQKQDIALQDYGKALFKILLEKGYGYNDAIKLASEQIDKSKKLYWGLDVFEALVKKEQGYEKAIEAASRTMELAQGNDAVLNRVLNIFQALVEQGQGYEKAIEAASQVMKKASNNPDVLAKVLDVFEALVKKGQGYKKAIETASQVVALASARDYDVLVKALDVFRVLVEKEQGYEDAIKAVSRAMELAPHQYTTDAWGKVLDIFKALVAKGQYDKVLDIFKALVKKGQSYKNVIEAAFIAMELASKSNNPNALAKVLDIFEALVEKGQGEKVIEAASQEIEKEPGNYTVLNRLMDVFEAVVKKGQGYDKVIEAASRAMKLASNDSYALAKVLDVFQALVEKGQGYETAIEAASQAMEKAPGAYPVWNRVLYLFEAVVKREKCYDKVIEAASRAMELASNNPDVLAKVLDVFEALVKKGRGYDKAIEATSRAMELAQGNDVLLNRVLYVFKALVEQGQGYEKAIEAASQAIESSVPAVKAQSLELCKVLVEKISSLIGQEPKYKQRIANVSRGIASNRDDLHRRAINSLNAIVQEWKQSSSVPK